MSDDMGSFTAWLVQARDPSSERYQEVWQQIAPRVGAQVFALARKHGMRDAEARDLAQDVLAKLVMVIGQFDRSRGRAKTWVWVIAKNILKDHLRQSAARPFLLPEEEHRLVLNALVGPDPAAETSAARELEDAEQALRNEHPRTFEVYDLSYKQAWPVENVANRLQTSVGQIYNERSKALKFLRDRLLGEEGD
jgi:RNA polymerase sigma factor (sigma-70 family)